MFKLAHISDIHLGPLPDLSFRELASKRITGFVNWHRNRRNHLVGNTLDLSDGRYRARDPDHLAITGDLVNLASSREIEIVTDWLKEAGDPENISIVPGNHDAYVPGAYEKTTKRLVSLYARRTAHRRSGTRISTAFPICAFAARWR